MMECAAQDTARGTAEDSACGTVEDTAEGIAEIERMMQVVPAN